ncbi:RluA family pseudouridine synthase [Candidatus Uabimicrobium sp. HlEnr_7]|uniref:RluA family pseudouridine synthase n=1 Tax=Candidatus Uabimicrobium helgolandensis TaxID=3095367 RepID=UPI0035579CAB
MKRRYNFTVTAEYQGFTIEEYLHQHLHQFPKSTVKKFIYDGLVKINGSVVKIHRQIREKNEISILLPKENKEYKQQNLKIEVLYEDEGFLVVNKPPLIAVIPERWSHDTLFRDCIRDHLKNDKIIPRIVHRIDKEASGALIVAKNKEFERYFSGLFAKREVRKKYLAIVAGTPADSGTVNLPLKQVSNKSTRMMVEEEQGKKAITHFKVVEFFRDFALLEVEIESGRTHQIRVHMASQGTPLAIDSLYGYRNTLKLSDLKSSYYHKEERLEKPIVSRLTLHASELEFLHPGKQEKITVTAPLFKDFEVFLKKLRKYRS